MILKKYLLTAVLGLSLSACMTPPPSHSPTPQPKPENPAQQQTLKEIPLNHNLPIQPLSNWAYLFGADSRRDQAGNPTSVIKNRVAVFDSARALEADLLQKLSGMQNVPQQNHARIAKTITQQFATIDFKQNDLIIVYLTAGGPPFGQYQYQATGNNRWDFCMNKATNNGVSGMALRTTFKAYAAPKGASATHCGQPS